MERIAAVRTVPRAWLPVEIYPISAGIKGGLAGGAAMAVLAAALRDLERQRDLVSDESSGCRIVSRDGDGNGQADRELSISNRFLLAVPIHLLISLLVGLLYGAMLPMLPRRPILLGGFMAPLLWSGLIYGVLAFINPVMNQRIDWLWFVLSQIGFGIVAGIVVARSGTNPDAPERTADRSHGYRSARPDAGTPAGGRERDEVRRPQSRSRCWALYLVWSAGPPAAEAPVIRPSEVADFRLLYGQNCSGCHGADGQGAIDAWRSARPCTSPSPTMPRSAASPSEGRPGTAMPAFAQKAGGLLTDAQIDILVRGIRARWARPDAFDKDKPPAYAASQPGDAARGHNVFTAFCSSCHGPDGRGGRAIVATVRISRW